MKARISLYPSPRTEISAHWMSPKPPGWTTEGGWLTFTEAYEAPDWDLNTGLTVYLDREQAIRLQRVLNELVEKMPDPTGPHGVEVTVS